MPLDSVPAVSGCCFHEDAAVSYQRTVPDVPFISNCAAVCAGAFSTAAECPISTAQP